jgi:hypothetical protein
MEKQPTTQREERLYHREDHHSDRWVRSIRAFLGTEHTVDVLSKTKSSPENFHPLRLQAKSTMQSFRPIETANAAEFLLSGIGKSSNEKEIKAAQFLFTHLDLMKMSREEINNAFTSAITEETPADNIEAIIQTGLLAEFSIMNPETKRAIKSALNHIKKSFPHIKQNHDPEHWTKKLFDNSQKRNK